MEQQEPDDHGAQHPATIGPVGQASFDLAMLAGYQSPVAQPDHRLTA
jgi:hypothetical protein